LFEEEGNKRNPSALTHRLPKSSFKKREISTFSEIVSFVSHTSPTFDIFAKNPGVFFQKLVEADIDKRQTADSRQKI
jgi:hypothetical protein